MDPIKYHSHKTLEITELYILVFIFLDRIREDRSVSRALYNLF